MTVVAAFGLALGGVFGMVGTVVTQQKCSSGFVGHYDVVGGRYGPPLMKFFRRGVHWVAGGFLWSELRGRLMLSGTATTLAGSVLFGLPRARPYGLPPFCSQVFPRNSPVGCSPALLVQFFLRLQRQESLGGPVLPTSSPLPFFASPFLVLVSSVGWMWTLLKAA